MIFLVLPFGILIEKVIKAKKYLLLLFAAWLLDVSGMFIIGAFLAKENEIVAGHGASGLAFALSPVIAGMSMIYSMMLHLIAIAVGVVFAFIFRKTVNDFFKS